MKKLRRKPSLELCVCLLLWQQVFYLIRRHKKEILRKSNLIIENKEDFKL
jgi:hypothetical protein